MPVTSAGKDSLVVAACGTRTTKGAIIPVVSVLEVDVDASTTVALDVGAAALDGGVARGGAITVGASAEVDQRPDVDADVLDGVGAAAGVGATPGVGAAAGPVKAEPGAFADGASTAGVGGTAADERPADDATAAAGGADDKVVAGEVPGKVGRGGGFAAGGGDAAGAGRGGGTVGIADLETGLLTAAARGAPVGPAAEGVVARR